MACRGIEIEARRRLLRKVMRSKGSLERWADNYSKRAEELQGQIVAELEKLAHRPPYHDFTAHTEYLLRLRRRRTELSERFCLVLHASRVDKKLIRALSRDSSRARAIARVVAGSDESWRVARKASVLLDAEGIFCVTLIGKKARVQPGFINLVNRHENETAWFGTFTLLAEMAYAILYFGAFGLNLHRELRWLDLAGLKPRTLFNSRKKLSRLGGEARMWPLVEAVEAVHEVAKAPPGWPTTEYP